VQLPTSFRPNHTARAGAALLGALALSTTAFVVPAQGTDVDVDGDGHAGAADCAPYNPAVSPSATDVPDLQFTDTNCDGIDGDAAEAVFVSPSGSDAAVGSPHQPFATMQKAVNVAKDGGKQVYAAVGTYTGGVVLATNYDGVRIFGGYEQGPWTRTHETATTIHGNGAAVLLDGASDVLLQLVSVRALAHAGSGTSVYGVRAVNNSEVALEGTTVSTPTALAGSPGGSGSTPAKASSGAAGTAGSCETPGIGGNSPFSPGGKGGNGGEETNDGENGTAGSPGGGFLGGAGGAGGIDTAGDSSPANGAPGSPGSPGASGSHGAGGANDLNQAGTLWAGRNGQQGFAGGSGGSGGGGGGGAGNGSLFNWAAGGGGGQGGAGGQGGGPADGGTFGGGSFGVYLANSQVLVTDGSSITAGNGGVGGAGGQGGNGGAGGDGGQGGPGGSLASCNRQAGNGGNGGPGGPGGAGGNGGGGSGGPSIAIFRGGTSTATVVGTSQLAHGTGGAGGVGPGSAADGQQGQSGGILPAPQAAATDYDGDGRTDSSDACPTMSGGSADADNDGCPEAPSTTITGGPADGSFSLQPTAAFVLGSGEASSTLVCSLDDGAGTPCGPAYEASGLGQGTHHLRAWATDAAGSADPEGAGRTWAVPFNNTTLKHSKGWAKKKASGYYLRSYSQTTKKGRSLSRPVTDVRSIALVASKGKGFGQVKVFLGKQLLKKVSLSATKAKKKQLIDVASFPEARDGTVRIVVATAGKTVRIEGLGLLTE
jgi:hypothetical protein